MPASAMSKSAFDRDVAMLRDAGYRVKVAPRIRFASPASPQDRAADLADLVNSPVYDGIDYGHGNTNLTVDHLRAVTVDAYGVMRGLPR